MKLVKVESSINHDYFHLVKNVYPKIINSVENIFLAFKENRDASKYFVEFFEKGHREIHIELNTNMSCEKINELLYNLFLSVTKYDSKSFSYEIPHLFYNYNAVHYYHKIKNIFSTLVKNNFTSEKIVDYLVKYEIERHENNECSCGESHELLSSFEYIEFFTKLLNYYYSVNNPCFEKNIMNLENEYMLLN